MVVGGVSALYGVVQASVATDLKRLLAYSTTENLGLITLALGAATLFAASGAHGPATIAAAAAMLHLIAHAAFKSLGFLAAGSVLAATGLRDLDRLGGLARRMPATTILFGVAALGACRAAAGRRVRQRVAAGPVADPHGSEARHRLGLDHAAGGGRGRAHHGPGRGGDGQGVRDRIPGAPAFRGGGRGPRGTAHHAGRHGDRGGRLPDAGGGALGPRTRAALGRSPRYPLPGRCNSPIWAP